MSILIADPSIVTLANTVERVSITVQDNSSDPPVNTDPATIILEVMDSGGGLRIYDQWPSPANRIVKSATGKFYVDFGYPKAKLNGIHVAGVMTLAINNAVPTVTAAWEDSGSLILDYGLSTEETVGYSAVAVVAGVGTFTLTSPTQKTHASGSLIRGTNTETTPSSDWLFNWQVELVTNAEKTSVIQKVKSISPFAASFLPDLRQLIDKSHKLVDSSNDVFLGYTDAQLFGYLEGGIGNINAYQPSTTFTLDTYPTQFKQILLDAALITGVMSQELYAIDSDVPNYNDQGTSFVIAHQPQLAAFLNALTQRLDKLIPQFKLQVINPGALHTQMGPNWRLQTMVGTSPNGALFRNVYFNG